MSIIASVAELEAIYGQPNDASTVKVADRITPEYRKLIAVSPFAALATSGPEGLDCSPRGDAAGFIRIHDEKTLMMPDRRGNNRVDSLRNIVRDPRIALLFLIPGVGSTLRIRASEFRHTPPGENRPDSLVVYFNASCLCGASDHEMTGGGFYLNVCQEQGPVAQVLNGDRNN